MAFTRVALGAALVCGCAGGSTGGPAPLPTGPALAATPYVVDTLATGLKNPWSLAFLPGGAMLVVEKYGAIQLYPKGASAGQVIEGVPEALRLEDSGLLDIAVDPRFGENHLVYFSFAQGDSTANHTALFRARLDGNRLADGRVIFRASPDKKGPNHPGSRIAFLPDETLLLTIGEGYNYREQAQQLGSALGKVVRLDREGGRQPTIPLPIRRARSPRSIATATATPRDCWSTGATARCGSTSTDPRAGMRSIVSGRA